MKEEKKNAIKNSGTMHIYKSSYSKSFMQY